MSRILAFVLFAVGVHQVASAAAYIPVGGVCGTIAGPISSRCVPGSTCCEVFPDLHLCALTPKGECPREFIPEGGFCAGIAGPVGSCYPGTECCYLSPDNGVCLPADKCKPIKPL